jgi:transposase
MPRTAPVVELSQEERQQLDAVLRRRTAGQLEVLRAKIFLAASTGALNTEIARRLKTREATVCKIRRRFAPEPLGALRDAPRSGRKPKYGAETEGRVLATLDAPRPKGYARWNGRLVAEHLGDVNAHHVWRLLRRRGIHLERRRSWCLSTDPEFERKAADIVGLYLSPPHHAVGAGDR